MGEVYLAYDPRLERSVALKVLPPELAADPRRMRRFVQEAKTTSSLNHPNLITIHEISQDGSIHFIATEFVDGVTLREYLRTTRPQLKETLGIIIQVCHALAAAHEAGVVHRDIKPENIMLRRRDQIVKVLDFGLAKLVETSIEQGISDPDAMTKPFIHTEPHVIMGTVRYMSPEQARGLPIDARTDVWSVGVVLYEMLADRPPFDGPTHSDVIVSILDREPASITGYAPTISVELQRLIKRTLAKDREKRYQSIKDLAVDLESLRLDLEMSSERERSSSSAVPAVGSPAQTTFDVTRRSTSQLDVQREPFQQLSGTAHIVAGIKQLNKWLVIGLLVLFTLAAGYFYFKPTTPAIDSIAVLPFANLDGDPNMEYLSDGITETLTNNISQLPGLSVIARSSVFRFKGRDIDPQSIGRQLRVRAVITGRIVQRGDRLVISAEMVDVENNLRMWGGQYDRRMADILAIQSEISREISDQLRLRLTSAQQKRLVKHDTENTEAYQLYLKGRFYWNKRTGNDLQKAIDYFNQATAKDSSYALAYAGLGDCYVVLPNYSDIPSQEAYLKAKTAALKALEIDDSLAEAHTTLAGIKSDYEWDFASAETELKRALALNPNYATAHHWYAQYLSTMGRHNEAIAEIKRAQELDPFSLIINAVLGDTYTKARHYDEAIDQLRNTIEMDKNFGRAHRYLANAYLEKGMYNEAVDELETAEILAGEKQESAAKKAKSLKEAYAIGNVNGFWSKQLEFLKEDEQRRTISPYAIASVYARLGAKEETLRWLEQALRDRDPYLVYLKIEPQFDSLRSDPRVIDLLGRIGIPQ
jgi:serine/threonine protein kinase/TolB-like protein/lipopolysaccharide biosynthesis regulator YciM